MIKEGFSCGNCGEGPYFSKQAMFTLEDVEHIIEYVLDMTLPDALAKVRATQAIHANLREKTNGIEPCWDCRMMIPELLNMNMVKEE